MSKFDVGDQVTITSNALSLYAAKGKILQLISPDAPAKVCIYMVDVNELGVDVPCYETELELARPTINIIEE